jgi:hypothetical protein
LPARDRSSSSALGAAKAYGRRAVPLLRSSAFSIECNVIHQRLDKEIVEPVDFRREMAERSAMGASERQVLGLVMGRGIRLALGGAHHA